MRTQVDALSEGRAVEKPGSGRPDMETVVGYILLSGVLLSISLILAGLAWHWARVGDLKFDYTIAGMSLASFVFRDFQQLDPSVARPRALINVGIALLMLTPYVRVLVSALYFGFVERNWKYTLFTTLVLAVLTYSLFLR